MEKSILNNARKKKQHLVFIIDHIYPLAKLTKPVYEIKDHINLSGYNPLKGSCFLSLTNIYNSKKGIIVACLQSGVHPNKKETKILLKAGVKAYCYNLLSATIHAASVGSKIKAIGIVNHKKL